MTANGALADGRFILKDAQHTYAAPFVTGVRRPDVAKALRSNAAADAGYTLTTSLTGVAAGTYAMYAADAANPATLCDFHRTLVVAGARE